MEATGTIDSEFAQRAGSDSGLRIGSRCFIRASTSAPRFSFHRGIVTGGLEMREHYDEYGELQGKRLAYKISVNGEEVCAPPDMVEAR